LPSGLVPSVRSCEATEAQQAAAVLPVVEAVDRAAVDRVVVDRAAVAKPYLRPSSLLTPLAT